MVNHKVVKDKDGWRLTCKGEDCHERTIIRHRWMTVDQWRTAQEEFLAQHPCSQIEDLDQPCFK